MMAYFRCRFERLDRVVGGLRELTGILEVGRDDELV